MRRRGEAHYATAAALKGEVTLASHTCTIPHRVMPSSSRRSDSCTMCICLRHRRHPWPRVAVLARAGPLLASLASIAPRGDAGRAKRAAWRLPMSILESRHQPAIKKKGPTRLGALGCLSRNKTRAGGCQSRRLSGLCRPVSSLKERAILKPARICGPHLPTAISDPVL